jgi:hypothetical protein
VRARAILGVAGWLFLGVALSGCQRESSTAMSSQEDAPPIAPAAITLRDLKGGSVAPLATAEAALTVCFFVAPDCPISNRYAPEIARLHARFATNRVVFWIVYPGTHSSLQELRQHAAEYRFPCAALRDADLTLARVAKARVTPEAAVFTRGGKLVYHGRIDDKFADFGVERPRATRQDLETAIESALQGRPVNPSSTRAVGCPLPE